MNARTPATHTPFTLTSGALFSLLICLLLMPMMGKAGRLDPPGPPSPTMRSLTEVETRIPIGSLPGNAEAMFVISEPGTYYLTEDIFAPKGIIAILIGLVEPRPGGNHVTIDLNGHSIIGQSVDSGACACMPGWRGITIMDSTGGASSLRGWKTALDFWFIPDVDDVVLVAFSNVDIADCAADGILAPRGVELSVRDVRIERCDGNGIRTQGCWPGQPLSYELKNVQITSVVGDGIRHTCGSSPACILAHEAVHVVQAKGSGVHVVLPSEGARMSLRQESCEMSSNGGSGLRVSCPSSSSFDYVGRNIVCSSNGASGALLEGDPDQPSIVGFDDSTFTKNGGNGVAVVSNNETLSVGVDSLLRLSSCVASNNGGSGISSASPLHVENTTAGGNALYGITVGGNDPNGSVGSMDRCVVEGNGSHGVTTLSAIAKGRYAVARSEINDNGGDGIHWKQGCLLVSGCKIGRNDGDGIFAGGTLNIDDTSIRRSGGFGVRQVGGSTVANGLVCEFNGRIPELPGGGASFIEQDNIYVARSVFSNNQGTGFTLFLPDGTPLRCVVSTSTASNNKGDGFALNGCTGELSDCSAIGNEGWGFVLADGSVRMKVASNTATGNGGGILNQGSASLIIGNTVTTGPLGSIVVAPGNFPGPIGGPALLADGNPYTNIVH